MKKKIFLDMDGVLCDFSRGYIEHYGMDFAIEDIAYWGYALDVWKNSGKRVRDFWNGLDVAFWQNLERTPECDQILELVSSYKPVLLTAPPLGSSSWQAVAGKTMWIQSNLRDYFYEGRFLIGPAKEYCAGPDSILIDDCQDNCVKWETEGGKAIMVPRPWNDYRGLPVVVTIQLQLMELLGEEY